MFSIFFLAVKDHRVVSAETPLYKFDYYEDDKLNMNISLWNQPHGVTTDMFLIKDPGEFVRVHLDSHFKKLFNLLR